MKSELIYKHIGSLIKSRRKQLRFTQEKLAKRLAMSRASLASIETGRQNVLVHQLYILAAALDLEPGDFLLALKNPIPNSDLGKLPLPAGLNTQQKEQVARLMLMGSEGETNQSGEGDEYSAKARPQKRSARAS
ncbi:MAG: helix-turn-helix transcriptional regulator [Rhodocyclales bacterium]|nr:helix-turn-helix transcriptional regulator [Rhodocyclales bacterium]